MSAFDLDRFKSGRVKYVTAHGKRIAVETLEPKTPAPWRRKPFKAHFIRLPEFWMAQLEHAKGKATYHLAIRILHEAFKRQFIPGSVVLSAAVTGLARTCRHKATKDMLQLKLIGIKQEGNKAAIVTKLLLGNGETLDLERGLAFSPEVPSVPSRGT
jgi:hypothetical protein